MKKQATTTAKEVTVLNVYRFKAPLSRICFVIESSNGEDQYNCCFNGDTAHAACGCDRFVKGHKECYHIEQLRGRAQEYFDSRKPAQAEQVVAPLHSNVAEHTLE